MKLRALLAAACSLAPSALAQVSPPLVGIDLRGTDRFFTAEADNLLASYSPGAFLSVDPTLFALDFDAEAEELWGVVRSTGECGRIDPSTGGFTPVGVVPGFIGTCNGLTCSPSGIWYAITGFGSGTRLWTGDVKTASFALAGTMTTSLLMIDLSADRNGDLFLHSVTDDALYRVDIPSITPVRMGFTGVNTEFAQGMDFDWRSNRLFAHLYEGGGVGTFCELDPATGAVIDPVDTTNRDFELVFAVQSTLDGPPIGSSYCVATPNSTGNAASIEAFGSASVADGDLVLVARDLPPQQFGIFVTSRLQGSFTPPSSNGTLCLSGSIGRFRRPDQIRNSGAGGSFSLEVDTTSIPQGAGLSPILAGETWHFQAWFRDGVGQGSNLTDGVRVSFGN